MHRGIDTAHGIGQLHVAINSAVETIEYTQIACRSQAPEYHHQSLHNITPMPNLLYWNIAPSLDTH